MKSWLSIPACVVLLGLHTTARADFIVSIADVTLAPGQTGFIDVSIRSTAGDRLDVFGAEFRISTLLGNHRLEFVDPASDNQLVDPSYIFDSNSAAASIGAPSGSISTVSGFNDTYIGGDGTLDGMGITVPSTDKLLVRLEVTAATALAPVAGDRFTISLVSSPNTFFADTNLTNIHFTSDPGIVTVSGVGSVVPEPSSLALLTIGSLGFVCAAWRSRTTLGHSSSADSERSDGD